MNHSEAMGNVHPPLQRSTGFWSRVRPMLTGDATWQPIYRGLVWAVGLFCGPVFLAVALVLVLT